MKIIHFTFMNSKKYGGLERFFVELVKVSQAVDIKHIIVYDSVPVSQKYLEDITAAGGEIVILPPQGHIKRFFTVYKFLRRQRPDAIQSYFNVVAGFITFFAAFMLGVKTRILSLHGLFEKSWKLKLFFTVFNWFITDIIYVSQGVKESCCKLITRSESKQNVLYLGIKLDAVETAGSGTVRQELNIPENAIVIGNTAFSDPIKGIDILINAFIKAAAVRSNIYLLQIGSNKNDSFMEILQQCGNKDIAERVIFLGITDHVAKYLPAMDIFVLSSRSEAISLALMEAAAAGLPAVGSKIGGIPEAIIENENGFTFPAADSDALAEKMLLLIDDPALRKHFSANARKLYSEKFRLTGQAEKYRDFYLKKHKK